ncbi:MAG: sulfotransferase family protein [Pseudomonadota bacterium]
MMPLLMEDDSKLPTRVLAVVGMHRSGTSCLTGSLEQAGLGLGEVHTWNRYNRRGNREKQSIVDLNDEVLAANQGSWDQPPKTCSWSDDQVLRARELIAGLNGHACAGFKDPRSLLTIEGWLRAVPHLEFVGVFRSPHAVASSLAHRSAMPWEQAIRLWTIYNARLLELQERYRFPLINFDVDEAQYLKVVGDLVRILDLNGSSVGRSPFFDDALRNSQRESKSFTLPYRTKLLHWRLKRRAVGL